MGRKAGERGDIDKREQQWKDPLATQSRGRIGRVRLTEALVECASGLYLIFNSRSHVPSTRTLGKSSCVTSEPGTGSIPPREQSSTCR